MLDIILPVLLLIALGGAAWYLACNGERARMYKAIEDEVGYGKD